MSRLAAQSESRHAAPATAAAGCSQHVEIDHAIGASPDRPINALHHDPAVVAQSLDLTSHQPQLEYRKLSGRRINEL